MKTKVAQIVKTKSGSVNKNITNALGHCRFDGNKIYTGYYSGSGRFTTAHSSIFTVKQLLEAANYKFTVQNDSKFGGIKGEHVIAGKVAIDFLKEIAASK